MAAWQYWIREQSAGAEFTLQRIATMMGIWLTPRVRRMLWTGRNGCNVEVPYGGLAGHLGDVQAHVGHFQHVAAARRIPGVPCSSPGRTRN